MLQSSAEFVSEVTVQWTRSIALGFGDLLGIPVLVAILSGVTLLSQYVWKAVDKQAEQKPRVPVPGIGKGSIFAFRLARLLICLGLLSLSVASFVHGRTGDTLPQCQAMQLAQSVTYLYASLLAFLSTNPKYYRQNLVRHLNCIILAAFCVYSYRDIFPLGTFTRAPADRDEGPIMLWSKIALLFSASVMIPLLTPRKHIPVDASNPAREVNPEKTASILSLISFNFLNRIIISAYRNSSLKEEELDPLCDNDAAQYLKDTNFCYLDVFSGSKSRRHIFFGLFFVFRWDFVIMSMLVLLRVLSTVLSPVAMNGLLQYLETGGLDAVFRPWVWIFLLFLAPTLESLGVQLYLFINTRVLVQAEAIITELVFDHSLRIHVKTETHPTKAAPGSAKPARAQGNLNGKITNLVTTDMSSIVESRDFLYLLLFMPIQIALCIWFLYVILGWAALVAFASIVLLIPVPGYVSRFGQGIQKERLKHTDHRVQSVNEVVNILRMIKFFGWEHKMSDRIGEKRDMELLWMRKRRIWELFAALVKFVISALVLVQNEFRNRQLPCALLHNVGDFWNITLIMGEALNASKVFPSITVFEMLSSTISQMNFRLNQVINARVSFDRLNDFLNETELLDSFDTASVAINSDSDERIGIKKAIFSWTRVHRGENLDTPVQRNFLMTIEDELTFERGRLNLVIGPTGSGKTSLLMALLGEMHYTPTSPDSWCNLPRAGGIAYAAQESWVLNCTIRENIVFDTPFDEERYRKVLHQCALEPDLALFRAGDLVEVGEKGLTLSGGQKARITLARAVYSTASILLLDDIFASLDVHTSQFIVDNCFGGDLIAGRTVILITHNVALLRPIASYIVSINSAGRAGSISSPVVQKHMAAQIQKGQALIDKSHQEIDATAVVEAHPPVTTNGKLIVAEEVKVGHVSSSTVKMFITAMGGDHPFVFFFLLVSGLVLDQVLGVLRTWVLGLWASQYDIHSPDQW